MKKKSVEKKVALKTAPKQNFQLKQKKEFQKTPQLSQVQTILQNKQMISQKSEPEESEETILRNQLEFDKPTRSYNNEDEEKKKTVQLIQQIEEIDYGKRGKKQNVTQSQNLKQKVQITKENTQLKGLFKSEKPITQSLTQVQTESNDSKFMKLIHQLKSQCIPIIKEHQLENSSQVIGKGGFGLVFAGTWMSYHVAIKEMNISYDEFHVMQAELEFLAKCRFPTIIQFYGLAIKELTKDETLQCQIVMELMEMDLDKFIFTDKSKKEKKVLYRILFQMAQAINFLHQNEIVHRDIKPQNVLLDKNLNAKLTDLGIARVLENKQMTQNATIAFTMRYASYETALEEVTSFKSDVWSFGFVIYEVITQRRVWEKIDKQSKIIVSLSKHESPFVDNWEQIVNEPQLVNLIKKTACYNVEERMTMKEVEDILSKLVMNS